MDPAPARQPAAIALGSNLGDRAATLESALSCIARLPSTALLARSAFIETEPVGPPGQGPYLNAAATIETGLSPRDLLEALLAIERDHGRARTPGERWGPRTLDLDLLLYGGRILREPGLTLPHPRLHERAFVLVPLAQVASAWPIPGLNLTVAEALSRLPRSSA